ncbi:hypothetical protein C8R45DRAFT_985435 [Mycena sanguinolenta]|nr:hypothetical protein C8R45DRAFT_985435 [Mycena sanguinolenta]
MPSLDARCAMHSHSIRQITGNDKTNEDGIADKGSAANNDGSTSFDLTPDSSVFQNILWSSLPSGAIAGIAVIVIVFVVCVITLLWLIWQRRLHHRVKLSDAEVNGELTTIPPFMPPEESDARSTSASTIARQSLETQLRAAAEKMAELEELTAGSTTTISEPDASGGNESVGSGSAASPPPDLEAELRAAREQINVLIARMNALDAAWGMGMGVEPPPEYA